MSGLIRCPKCGAAMVASRTRSKKTKTGEIVNHLYYSSMPKCFGERFGQT
ncbi:MULTISPECIES: recombinase zinc beta ribbon domain-containing protein [Paenibacillaceae]|nr:MULTISPECIES: zinc ribbon domain-containing protein [Bacillales]TQR35713.1 hypothetical protein C7Y45_15395 [Lysinibacillus sp. SDF0063]